MLPTIVWFLLFHALLCRTCLHPEIKPRGPRGGWNIVSVSIEQHQRFTQLITGDYIGSGDHSRYLALQTLGTLAAGHAYFNQYEDTNEITIVRTRPVSEWRQTSKQFKVCIESIGGELGRRSLESAVQNQELVTIPGPLPSPADTIAMPGLESLAGKLAHEAATERRNFRHGIGYVWMTRQKIGAALSIGYADPYTGHRFEAEFSMGLLKSQHGYPPPPLPRSKP